MPRCPMCGSRVSEEDIYCSRCGCSLNEEPRPLPQLRKPTAPPTGLASSIKESFVSLFRPMPPVAKPTMLVYEKLPSYTPIKKYVYIGIALTLVGIILLYVYPMVVYSIHIPWLQFMGAAIAAPIVEEPLKILGVFWLARHPRLSIQCFGGRWLGLAKVRKGRIEGIDLIPGQGKNLRS